MPFFAMKILHHDDCWMKPTSIVDPWIIDACVKCDALFLYTSDGGGDDGGGGGGDGGDDDSMLLCEQVV